ncbi:hypothetical protein BDU57DRAFT_68412 [Ampelomyces quisqualis]|uniref:Uncharacterized protein n=1 Tax=Ampelomyces quisqualis TaxID=50730 RepID=A0A6A5R2U6_AMPQU|nr:hypothetical protein BDU57DRAFT_68412 [Ampelomyces quisqualis]
MLSTRPIALCALSHLQGRPRHHPTPQHLRNHDMQRMCPPLHVIGSVNAAGRIKGTRMHMPSRELVQREACKLLREPPPRSRAVGMWLERILRNGTRSPVATPDAPNQACARLYYFCQFTPLAGMLEQSHMRLRQTLQASHRYPIDSTHTRVGKRAALRAPLPPCEPRVAVLTFNDVTGVGKGHHPRSGIIMACFGFCKDLRCHERDLRIPTTRTTNIAWLYIHSTYSLACTRIALV